MARVWIHRLVALVAFLLIFPVKPVLGDCYTPDGETWGYHEKCYSPLVGAMTSCCHNQDMCLENLLCTHIDATGNHTYYRGTCSNSANWSLETCPDFCKGHTEADSHLGEWPVGKCPDDGTNIDRWFCIGNETGYGTVDDCKDPAFGFSLNGDTSTFWTAGIMKTHTPEPTPPTSTRISWKGTVTTSDLSSTAISIDQQSSTSISDAFPPSSEPSSLPDVNPSSTSAVVIATSTTSDAMTLWTSVDPATSTYVPLTTATVTDGSVASSPGTFSSVQSMTLDISTAPPPPPTAQSTVTVIPSPSGNATDTGGTHSKTIPIAVGVSIGTPVLIAIAAWCFFSVRHRRRRAPARAESPPPYAPEPAADTAADHRRHLAPEDK